MIAYFAANEDCVISILPPVLASEATTVIQKISLPSKKVKAAGKGVYSGELKVVINGTSLVSGHMQSSPATVTIQPSLVKKNKADGKLILAVGDMGITDAEVSFSNGITTVNSKISVMISNAGQDKVLVV